MSGDIPITVYKHDSFAMIKNMDDQTVHETTEPILILENVSKSFASKQAVKDISIIVNRGEVFGFLGPNGAGKSTTIRMILDVLRPTAGSITLFGQSSQQTTVHRRLGYLSGDMSMDMDLTGEQYLSFVAAQYGKDCHEDRKRLAQILQADLTVKIGNYSRGNRQKIGLIAALQHQPELLILDEPTSGFDPLVQEQFASLIKSFKLAGSTVLMSSHILSEVQQLCDRVAFIKDGRIIDTTTVGSLTASAAKRVSIKVPINQLPALKKAVTALDGVHFKSSVEAYLLEFSYSGEPKALLQIIQNYEVQDITIQEPELEEIFMHYYNGQATVAAKATV